MNLRLNVTAIMLAGWLGSTVLAHSDIELFDHAGQVAVAPQIAEGEFGEDGNPTYRANDPGLESDPLELVGDGRTALPGGALVGFDLPTFTLGGSTKGLFYWDGEGSPDFVSIASPHGLKISDTTESFSLQANGSHGAAGFDFALTADGSGPDPAGFLHSHLKFDLIDSVGAGVGSPAAGVYAFATTFSVTGLGDSDPVYWVLASEVDEAAHQAAIDYISRSVGLVPEPSTLMLPVFALLSAMAARTRR
jgi:hypothetical protein